MLMLRMMRAVSNEHTEIVSFLLNGGVQEWLEMDEGLRLRRWVDISYVVGRGSQEGYFRYVKKARLDMKTLCEEARVNRKSDRALHGAGMWALVLRWMFENGL